MFSILSRKERALRYRGLRLLSHAIVHLSNRGHGDPDTIYAIGTLLAAQNVVLGIGQ
jgi:hypothetical protein